MGLGGLGLGIRFYFLGFSGPLSCFHEAQKVHTFFAGPTQQPTWRVSGCGFSWAVLGSV